MQIAFFLSSSPGKFAFCSDMSVTLEDNCVGTYLSYPEGDFLTMPSVQDRVWGSDFFNYDNIGRAMLTLLASATTEGWVDIMHNSIDATEIGEA